MRKYLGLSFIPVFSLAFALNAPVEDLGAGASPLPRTPASVQAQAAAQPQSNQALVDLYYEVQSLRDEIRELRGVVEEQANELRQLQQRQMDDFQDLDRRISNGALANADTGEGSTRIPPSQSGGGSTPSTAVTPGQSAESRTSSSSMSEPSSTVSLASDGDYKAYITNYNLIKARKIDEAIAGFNVFIAKFPNSQYTANSYYWLGEIYLLQNNLAEAETAFATVIQKYPAHRKALDAKFKLAKVYHLQGDNERAKVVLGEVANTNSSAAALAKAYLADNF